MEPTKAVYARAVIGSRTSSLSCACSLIPLLFLTAAGVGQGERAEPLREPSSCPVMSGRSHGTLRVIGSRQFRAVGPASVVAGYGVGWLSWSANGKRLVASGLGFGVRVWDADRKGEIRQLRSPADIYRPLALSPDSQRMALINPNGTVSIEAVKAGGPTRTLGSPVPPAPRPYEGSVCWSPDGKYLAAGGVDRKVTIWNAATGEKIRELAQPPGKGGEVFGVVWSPDGKQIATSGSNFVHIYAAATGVREKTLPVRGDDIAWSPSGQWFAVAGVFEGTIRVYTTAGWEQRLTLHHFNVGSVSWGPKDRYLATGGLDGKVRIWDAWGGEMLLELGYDHPDWDPDDVGAVAWSPDGKHLACGARGGILQIWDLELPRA